MTASSFRLLASLLLAAFLCLSLPAFAAAEEDPANYDSLAVESANILGRMGVAGIALSHGLTGEAQASIHSALDGLEQLQNETDSFKSKDEMTFAHFSFKGLAPAAIPGGKGKGGGGKGYLVPMINDALVVRTYDEKLLGSHGDDIMKANAEVVHGQVQFKVNALNAQLLQVQQDLANGNAPAALADLAIAQAKAVGHLNGSGNAFILAHGNLALALELLKDGNPTGAVSAINHARGQLASVQKSNPQLHANPDMSMLIRNLGSLRQTVRKNRLSVPSPETTIQNLMAQSDALSAKN